MHNTTAFSGGFKYRPTTSISFSSNRGSLDSLNVCTRCGLRPRPDQIRCTVAGLTSLAFAIDRQLQCVSPSGRPSCVSRTISSTLLAGIDGLRPRPLATRPNSRNPSAANRLRQPTTVLTATPHSAAILALATPSPASSRALDRTTSRCAAEVDLDNLCKVWRCPSDKASAGAGLFIAQSIARQAPIAIHYTSTSGEAPDLRCQDAAAGSLTVRRSVALSPVDGRRVLAPQVGLAPPATRIDAADQTAGPPP